MPQSDWAIVWLAVAAISLALMALMQIGAVIALLRAAKEGLQVVRGVQAQIAPLIDRGQVFLASANDAAHQAQDIVSRVGAQVERVEGAMTEASEKVTDLRRRVLPVTATVTGTVAGVRAFWSGLRRRDRLTMATRPLLTDGEHRRGSF